VFTARYGLIPCIKQITFRLLKVNEITIIERAWKTLTCARLRFSRRLLRGYCHMGCDSVCSELLHTNLIFIPCIMLTKYTPLLSIVNI
jgi:hypothetical protein